MSNKWKYMVVPKQGTILLIAPHPDDEIIGCGGVLLKHLLLKNKVFILYLTSGVEEGECYEKRKNIRDAERKKIVKSLNVESVSWDHNIDIECSGTNIQRLINIINDVQPDIIYIPCVNDRNKDHKMSAYLLKKALSKVENNSIGICEYAVWTPIFPNVLVNITEVFPYKVRLLQVYKSELQKYNFEKLIEGSGKYYLNLFHTNRHDWKIIVNEKRLFKKTVLNWEYAEPFVYWQKDDYIEYIQNAMEE